MCFLSELEAVIWAITHLYANKHFGIILLSLLQVLRKWHVIFWFVTISLSFHYEPLL